MKKTVFFLAVLLFTQCTSNSKKEASEIPKIDVSRNYPEREVFLQDVAKVEYIPLETNDNTLISSNSRIVYVSDNYIIVINLTQGDIFVFDGQGKSKFSFNNKGQSGTEYGYVSSIAFDEKAKEIFVSDRYSAIPRFLVYTEDGKFKRTFPFPPDFSPSEIYSYNDELLLVYDVFGLNQDNYSNKPYLLLSKNDGSIVDTIGIHLPVRVSDRIRFEGEVNGQKSMVILQIFTFNNRSYGKDFLIADWSSDSIYRLTPTKELQPVIVRTPPVQKSDPKMILSNSLITDKFVFLEKTVFDFEAAKNSSSIPSKDLMYDFETGQLNEYKLFNKDYKERSVGFTAAITSKNTGVYTLDVFRLLEADETGKVTGDLKPLLKTLDEEDNPILVKVTFF